MNIDSRVFKKTDRQTSKGSFFLLKGSSPFCCHTLHTYKDTLQLAGFPCFLQTGIIYWNLFAVFYNCDQIVMYVIVIKTIFFVKCLKIIVFAIQ